MPSVLVTGASRGIGLAIVKKLAAAGWDVYAGVRSVDDGKRVAAEAGGSVTPVTLDITSAQDIAALDAVLPSDLDAVVNNAGWVLHSPVETAPIDDVRRQYDVNVVAQIAVTQAVLPRLRRSKGRIVFISSVGGRISSPMTGVYNSSKYAIEAIGDTLRVELRPWGIKVVLIEPGAIATDIWHEMLDNHEAAFERLDDEQRELYRGLFERMRGVLRMMQKRAVPVDKVAAVVMRALTARSPRARYQVDFATKLQLAGSAITPTPVLDAIFAVGTGSRARK